MLTIRAIPPRADNALLADYHDGLRRHWSATRRASAALLAAAGRGGWSPAERRWLDAAVRRDGLSMRDRKGLHRLLNPAAFPFTTNPLKNKQLFARVAARHGLPVADAFDPATMLLPHWLAGQHDIIAKPSFRSKGQGVERFHRPDARWSGIAGPIGDAQLNDRLSALIAAGGVVQHCLPTHPALVALSPGALPTLRVVTCRDEAGAPESCALALRLSAGGPRPVDNFNAGNLVAGIDTAGCCGPARRAGPARVTAHGHHPVTRATIAGTPVPDLAAAIALARLAHAAFPDFTVIGWDVGLTPHGPVLVEGNWNPGTDILQLVAGQGVAATRLGALYRHHLARLPAERWRAARPIERDRQGR